MVVPGVAAGAQPASVDWKLPPEKQQGARNTEVLTGGGSKKGPIGSKGTSRINARRRREDGTTENRKKKKAKRWRQEQNKQLKEGTEK